MYGVWTLKGICEGCVVYVWIFIINLNARLCIYDLVYQENMVRYCQSSNAKY